MILKRVPACAGTGSAFGILNKGDEEDAFVKYGIEFEDSRSMVIDLAESEETFPRFQREELRIGFRTGKTI